MSKDFRLRSRHRLGTVLMRLGLSRLELGLIAAVAAASLGLWFWWVPARPDAAAAGRDAGIAAACGAPAGSGARVSTTM